MALNKNARGEISQLEATANFQALILKVSQSQAPKQRQIMYLMQCLMLKLSFLKNHLIPQLQSLTKTMKNLKKKLRKSRKERLTLTVRMNSLTTH